MSDTGEKGTLNFGTRLSDNGENGTQRIIAKMLTKHRYSDIQLSVLSCEGTLSVLNHEDILSEYGVPHSRAHANHHLDADGYKKVFSDDKEKSTKVPHSGYKFKGKGEFEYHFG